MAEALSIYRNVLDALTGHMIRGDGLSCTRFLALPFRMHLLDRTHVCATRSDVLRLIQNYRMLMREQGVTELRRTAEDARFLSPKVIEGYHVTEPLRASRPVADPYAIKSMLELRAGHWVSTEQEVIAETQDWPIFPPPKSAARQASHRGVAQ